MFLGVTWLAVHIHALPTESGTPSVLSQIARAVYPSSSTPGFMYWVVQVLTLAVLVLAANTSYQGFPRLAALLARDRFFARQFTNLGDRLVFSNGILVLTGISMALLWAYNADVNSLIHLYVIGVFTAFTLSQAGMVRYWLRTRDPGWAYRAPVNVVGAAATGLVTVIVIWTKFAEGAWLVIVAIPLLVLTFLGINRHYRRFGRRLQAGVEAVRLAGDGRRTRCSSGSRRSTSPPRERSGTRGASRAAGRSARCSRRAATPTRGSGRAGGTSRRRSRGSRRSSRRGSHAGAPRGGVAPAARRVGLRHRRRARAVPPRVGALGRRAHLVPLKLRLLSEPGVVVTDVPVVTTRRTPEHHTPSKLVVRVLLANVHAGAMRAITYANALGADDVRAVSFAFDDEEAALVPRPVEALRADDPARPE